MNVRFVATDPRQKARPLLDELLKRRCGPGSHRLRIPHLKSSNGMQRGSDCPTPSLWSRGNRQPACKQHKRCMLCVPAIFTSTLGAQTPAEKGVGGRPHALESVSSAAGDQCWLWTG